MGEKRKLKKENLLAVLSLPSFSERYLDVGGKLEWLVAILRPSLVISGNPSVWAIDKVLRPSPLT